MKRNPAYVIWIFVIGLAITAMSFKPAPATKEMVKVKTISYGSPVVMKKESGTEITAQALAFVRVACPRVAAAVVEACPEVLELALLAILGQPQNAIMHNSYSSADYYDIQSNVKVHQLDSN